MALLVLFFAIYCLKNTAQDLIYAVTGRVPPSFVREQRRIALAREAIAARASARPTHRPITPARGSRRFFRNAYNDAWESAEERRARWSAKKAQKRHKKWNDKDGTALVVPEPIDSSATPEAKVAPAPSPPVTPESDESAPPSGISPGRSNTAEANPTAIEVPTKASLARAAAKASDGDESGYQRYAMRRRNGTAMTTAAIAEEQDLSTADADDRRRAWEARWGRENATPAAGGTAGTPREEHDQKVREIADRAAQDPAEDTGPGGTTTSTKGIDDVTTETTGLQSGVTYAKEMATTCEQGAASVEQSITALQNGEVGAGVTGPMHQAQEHLQAAQNLFDEAGRMLEQQISVKEAYDATPDAGNKQFVTAE